MTDKLEKLGRLIEQHVSDDGPLETGLSRLMLFKETRLEARFPWVYEPVMMLATQGQKNIYLEGRRFGYGAGEILVLFMPMAVECEVIEASEASPLLGLGVRLDRHRLGNLLMTMETAGTPPPRPDAETVSGIFSAPASERLVDTATRLVASLEDPAEAAALGDNIIDEIYFRLLKHEQGGTLRYLLGQQGQIQQVCKAIEHLQSNLQRQVSVDELASVANMSASSFHRKFRDVMHVSPLQYAKLIRLNRARDLIIDGKGAGEAAYAVGYNSPAQFSRECKRQFGTTPSGVR
ncbi:MAG: AraC family transcriptional regulator [Pseudomonadota bacterium]